MHVAVSCPFRDRCNCECEAKITHAPEHVTLYFHKAHSAVDHLEKDTGKYLKFQQKYLIADAVKVAPLQTASELIRNVQDSPTKMIDHKLKNSVARLLRKRRSQAVSVALEGLTINNSVGSLSLLAYALWIVNAMTAHRKDGKCIDLFKVYVIGRQILESDRTVFLTFANVWNLLNFWRAVASGYDVQLFGDVTSKASSAALNKLAFGVNMLGSRFAPVACSLIPAKCESTQAYTQTYKAMKNAVRMLITIKLCTSADCATCRCIEQVRRNNVVKISTTTAPYTSVQLLPIPLPASYCPLQ